jgi:hypothetical protein
MLELSSVRLAYGVRVHIPGFAPSDDALTLEPGVARTLTLTPRVLDPAAQSAPSGALTALNLRGRVSLTAPEPSA